MHSTIKKLERLITNERKAANILFDNFPDSNLVIIELCKALDFYVFVPDHEKTKNKSLILDRLQMSFPVLLKEAFNKVSFKNYFPKKSSKELGISKSLDAFSFQTGELVYAQSLLDHAKAGFLSIQETTENTFLIKYKPASSSLEIIETSSWIEYFKRIEAGVERQIKVLAAQEDHIQNIMRELVEPSETAFIRYNTTPEIDYYYSQLGYYNFLSHEPYDLFAENALFGGVEYLKYVNVLMQLVGTAIKHTDYCFLLLEKHPQINLKDVICIHYELEKLISQYAQYMQIPETEMTQIFSCLTATPENIECHIKDHKSFSPVFIKVSDDHVMRSITGTFNKPMMFLMRELKRQFPDDYHRNTEREDMFRKQVYSLFIEKQIQKAKLLFAEQEVNIKSNGVHTDIDAAIFDTQSQSLALFQLKWQDLYAHDLKERRSRLSNYSKKAEEWIEKISRWINTNDSQTILQALKLTGKINKEQKVANVYLFVVNKWNGHFTEFHPDPKAAWTSWYNLLVIMERVSLHSDNYIKELYLKLKEELPDFKSLSDLNKGYEFTFQTFKIVHKR